MKPNPNGLVESIEILLTPDKFPVAFGEKVDELMEQNCFSTREEAEEYVKKTPISVELYYEKHSGLFAVEEGAVEACATSLCSPYSGRPFEEEAD